MELTRLEDAIGETFPVHLDQFTLFHAPPNKLLQPTRPAPLRSVVVTPDTRGTLQPQRLVEPRPNTRTVNMTQRMRTEK